MQIKNEKPSASENVIAQDGNLERTKNISVTAAQFIVLLSFAVFAPALNIQTLTGTLVNATLFIATVLLGVWAAIMIGMIPSIVSTVTGLLPATILPMVPFIILSNAILIVAFSVFKNKSFFKGVVLGGLAKFAFLSVASAFIMKFFIPANLASGIALMMSWPQLFTALSGGVLAYFILGAMKKLDKK